MKRHVPNFITLLNLASGFAALTFIINGDLLTASWLIVIAMVFDFGDGLAARVLNAYSETGKQLDSLADVVSFGVVPGVIVYTLIDGVQSEWVRIIFAALIPAFAALRLAKFNTDDGQKDVFIGLPTPAAAIAIISLIIAPEYNQSGMAALIVENPLTIIVYSVAIALLMVSPLRLISLKFKNLNLKDNLSRYILIILSLTAFIVLGIAGIILIIPFYLLISLSAQISR